MTVYVIQEPVRRVLTQGSDEVTYEKLFDLRSAEKYGEIRVLVGPFESPDESTLEKMKSALTGYTAADYLLLAGKPTFIGWAVAIAAHRSGGRVNLLQWDKREGRYLVFQSHLFQSRKMPA